MKYFLQVILLTLGLIGCQSNSGKDPFENCKYGKPKPIFPAESPMVNQHSFEIKGMEGIEEVSFSNGLSVTLVQTGCDYIQQEFQFTVPGNHQDKEAGFSQLDV